MFSWSEDFGASPAMPDDEAQTRASVMSEVLKRHLPKA
jgi:hypothetical protein